MRKPIPLDLALYRTGLACSLYETILDISVSHRALMAVRSMST